MVENNKLQKTVQIAGPSEQELFCTVIVQCLREQGSVLRWLSNTTPMKRK